MRGKLPLALVDKLYHILQKVDLSLQNDLRENKSLPELHLIKMPKFRHAYNQEHLQKIFGIRIEILLLLSRDQREIQHVNPLNFPDRNQNNLNGVNLVKWNLVYND